MIKSILKILLGLALLLGILYGGFHVWEYATGGKYVAYLEQNSETLPLNEAFTFAQLDQDLKDNELVLVGEIHGFEQPQKFDFELFKHLHENHNIRHYYAELDIVQSTLLNSYLNTGDEDLLKAIFKQWAVLQGRNNKDYLDKYRSFYAYYQQLPADEKFQFIGVDKMQDLDLATRFLNDLTPTTTKSLKSATSLHELLAQANFLDSVYANSSDTLFLLSHLKTNLNYVLDKAHREKVMFENFYALYSRHHAKKQKAYGFFGLYHVFQYQVNGKQPFASQIRMSDLGLEDKIISMNFLMNDSYMNMPSNQLPAFMTDGSAYYKMPISSDVMLFMYIYGVKDFKRMTPTHHKSLIKMNATNSPYAASNRLNTTIQLLPFAQKFEMNEKGKPYVQYTVFVRNSDWAEPED